MSLRLLIGLGNPGNAYRDTRHNVGFMLLDQLAKVARLEFRREKPWEAEVARMDDLIICKPTTFMNLSGRAVHAVSHFYKVLPAEIVVVLDEMALPLGKLRLRPAGTAGGHNGLKSIIEVLGTSEIPRLRIGIGAADPGAAVGHVLGRFEAGERLAIAESLNRAAAAVACIRREGLAVAMNQYN